MSINGIGRLLGHIEDRLRERGYSEEFIQTWRQQQLVKVAAVVDSAPSLKTLRAVLKRKQ